MKHMLCAIALAVLTVVPGFAFEAWPVNKVNRSVAMLTYADSDGQCTATAIAPRAYITANHCIIEEASPLIGEDPAALVVMDVVNDLAVLTITGTARPALQLGSSPKPGDEVAIFGHGLAAPFVMVIPGIVMALDQPTPWEEPSTKLFVSAQPLPGMSGGPITNRKGELVGIVQCGLRSIGCGVNYDPLARLVKRYR